MNELVIAETDEELTWELLAAYEIADQNYEAWCELVGMTAMSPSADSTYEIVHNAYARLWMTMGDQFFIRLAGYVEAWKTRARASERAGKPLLVRALTRLAGGA